MSNRQLSRARSAEEHSIYSQPTEPTPISSACVVQIVPSSEIEREALAMENLLQAFSLDEPFSLELYGDHNRQHFLLRTASEATQETLCQQILAQYPQAQLRRVPLLKDPLLLRDGEHALVGDFTLRTESWMPIKTFWEEEMTQQGTDPVVGILAAMEPVAAEERIICQITLIRAPDSWSQRYQRKALEHPLDKERQAGSRESASGDTLWQEVQHLLLPAIVLFAGIQGYWWYSNHAWGPLALSILLVLGGMAGWIWWKLRHRATLYDMNLVSQKLMRAAFYAQLRVIVVGGRRTSQRRLHQHLNRLEVAYRQYDLAGSNGFKLKQVRHITPGEEAVQLCLPECSLPYRHPLVRLLHRGWSDTLLNAREVSGMWHLLQAAAEVPMVERLSSKRILALPEVFQCIQQEAADLQPVLVGYSTHRGRTIPISLPEETLFSHKFVIAKSGYGKSTLMQLLLCGAMQPIRNPERLQPGVVAIDPHGDLIEDLLRQIPEARTQDVTLVDLSDEEHPIGINLLDATMGFSSDQAIANAMSSFSRIWKDSWGPRLAYVLKNVLRTLYLANEQLVLKGQKDLQYTLVDINTMLQQPKFARKVLGDLDKDNIQHQKTLSFWNDYYFKLPPAFQQEVISPVSNKIGIFSESSLLERIVGQPITTVDITLAVQTGQILLVNLASARLEFDAAAIIGATILNLVHRALQLQASIPFPSRRQVFIAVDEFQNIPGADYEALLSEDRKYGGSLMLATQSLVRLEQMKEGLQEMTFSNCSQLFVFATSADDAEKLEKELFEQVTVPHILNQPRLNCYARLALPDRPMQIFSMELAKPEGWNRSDSNEEKARQIRARAIARYPSRAEVDQNLIARHKRIMQPDQAQQQKQPQPANSANQQGKQVQQQKQPQPANNANQQGKQPNNANQQGKQPQPANNGNQQGKKAATPVPQTQQKAASPTPQGQQKAGNGQKPPLPQPQAKEMPPTRTATTPQPGAADHKSQIEPSTQRPTANNTPGADLPAQSANAEQKVEQGSPSASSSASQQAPVERPEEKQTRLLPALPPAPESQDIAQPATPGKTSSLPCIDEGDGLEEIDDDLEMEGEEALAGQAAQPAANNPQGMQPLAGGLQHKKRKNKKHKKVPANPAETPTLALPNKVEAS